MSVTPSRLSSRATPFGLNRPLVELAIVLAACAGVAPARAQAALSVATGAPKGTYASLFRDLQAVCGSRIGVPLVDKPSTGSAESLDRLLNNEVSAAFVQTDVLYQRAQVDDVAKIKALVPLHAEPVHVLAMAAEAGRSGVLSLVPAGWLGRHPPRSVSELGDRKLGAWGGGLITAQQIRLQGQINYQVVDLGTPDAALKALMSGQVDALMAVGGAPLEWMRGLDSRVRLLPMNEELIGRLRHVYRPAKLSYSNLGASGVATVATTAVLAVRDVRTPQASAPLLALRQCVQQQLGTLRETVGHHRAWGQVEPEADARWPAFGKG